MSKCSLNTIKINASILVKMSKKRGRMRGRERFGEHAHTYIYIWIPILDYIAMFVRKVACVSNVNPCAWVTVLRMKKMIHNNIDYEFPFPSRQKDVRIQKMMYCTNVSLTGICVYRHWIGQLSKQKHTLPTKYYEKWRWVTSFILC